MIQNLEAYLQKVSDDQRFKAELNNRLGYLKFSNSGQRGGVKYFTLGIDALLQTIIDINNNLHEFQNSERYVEKEWRDLGSKYYTDGTANAMATVQTKPLFCTLSKIISWANNIDVEDYDGDKISLNRQELDITIRKLEMLLSEYPKPNLMGSDIHVDKEPNTIYFGAPGTGKSHTVKQKLASVPKENTATVTFHPEYDYTSFVGGYKPITEKDENGNEDIKYKFVPQVFTNLYVKAWLNPAEQFCLVIEEINRGNCAEIFGDIFQLLDQNQDYKVTPSNELENYLLSKLPPESNGIVDGLKMPPNLSILATMNTSDQSLFPMDSAFKRRWDWEYIPINYDRSDDNKSSKFRVNIDEDEYFYWLDFIEYVNGIIKNNPNLGMDKCIGNYFVNPDSNIVTLKAFINKAVFYLWNDVFKDEFGDETIFNENISYEDFFPIETNGKEQVKAILQNLEINTHKFAEVDDEDTD